MSETINRGYLKRLIERGQVEMVSSYHFDDQFGSEQSKEVMPVRVKREHGDSLEGYCNLWESDFRSSCGSAHKNPDGTIHLRVHSNCFYDFRLKEGEVKPQSAPKFAVDSDYREQVQAFADKVQAQTLMWLIREGYGAQADSHLVKVAYGAKYARVDVGSSGCYMVDRDGEIYGIKGYGVVHRGHRYGNLSDIDKWQWGGYRAARMRV